MLFAFLPMRIHRIPRRVKRAVAFSCDLAASLLAVLLSIILSGVFTSALSRAQQAFFLIAPVTVLSIFFWAGIYRAISRYSGFRAFFTVFWASALSCFVLQILILIIDCPDVPPSVGIIQPMMFMFFAGGSRALVHFWFVQPPLLKRDGCKSEKLLIYGAGKAGSEIARALQRSGHFDLKGYLDNDRNLQGNTINGVPVFNPADADTLISRLGINTVLVAMPSASRARRMEIVSSFHGFPVCIKTLPGMEEIADGKVCISDIKPVGIEDILGREPVPVDRHLVDSILNGQVVMVTGAGGSIGSELCRQILEARPRMLLLLDHAEYNLYSIFSDLDGSLEQQLRRQECDILPLLCDVTDEHRFNEICRRYAPAVIYHAAAYKHVPMVEHNALEGVRNNVFGTMNLIMAAIRHDVSQVVLISTDKAVRPTSVMGTSKRLCEMIAQALAAEGNSKTCISMVRFGNVLGSSGSVVPLFRQQIREGGPVTVTDDAMTRYFMTIPEAAQLVIQAGAMATGGDVFVLDMGEPVRIVDLARRMIELSGLSVRDEHNSGGDVEVRITGLRPGEKLYEELLIGNNPAPTANPRIFKSNEHFIPWADLKTGLDKLAESIRTHDVSALKQALCSMVCEYKPSGTPTDPADPGKRAGNLARKGMARHAVNGSPIIRESIQGNIIPLNQSPHHEQR